MNQPLPAFPTPVFFDEVQIGIDHGMTLRDYFAAKAMQTYILFGVESYRHEGKMHVVTADYDVVAKQAYCMADQMMEARK